MQDIEARIAEIKATVDRTDSIIRARMARPYYPLDDGWGLTHLDSGQPFYVNTRDRTVTPWILMGGHWEVNVERPLCGYITPEMVIADIGAHCGYYSVKMGARINGGHLVAFEPNPEMNPFTENNLQINGLLFKSTLVKSALGREAGSATLSYHSGREAQASLVDEGGATTSFEVKVDTFDNAMRSFGAVNLIKLDAEGFEAMILEGSQETLKRSPDCAVMMELSLHRWERTHPIEDVARLIGEDKLIFAVTGDGKLRPMEMGDVKGMLQTCAFNENYFFFVPKIESRLERVKPFLVS